ncbi:hypothetical protein PMAYCL1PPCAC_14367 [Pristionchus mayeri]|uniref:Uncharacterized protein n=1 Tax=Pristionchus mayeri TaxID=1317129 RepID=A0AAN4ZTJ1_9BILA|nr:hypothetical protein PMAYCL1PPCAC_14367 [Pristionchus mayeri]
MSPSMPSTSRQSVPATPTSRKRPASFSSRDARAIAASKASRKGPHPAKPSLKAEQEDTEDDDDSSQMMDETSELMDNVVQYSDAGADDEEPCTSSILQHPQRTPARSAARAKPDRRRTGQRAASVESNESERSCVGSPKRKMFYTINDLVTNKPAERFRTDILQRVRNGDAEYMPHHDESTSTGPSVLRLTDRWREEWSHGVQVLLHPKNLPHFETKPCDIPHTSRGPFRLTPGKYLQSYPAPYQKDETHVLHEPPPLRIYQGDRLDELWLERLNREHAANRLPMMNLATMLNLMNEFEIECFKNIHRIVLTSLASPSSINNSSDGVDEDAPCDVCQIKEDNDDPMIFCDGCNICLHLTCYGLTEVPEGHWECDMCKAVGFTRHDRLRCSLCPNTGGAMKEVEGQDKWVHVSCAMWIPEIKFTYTRSGREVVQGLETIHDQRWQLKCSICDLRMGACVQCEYKSCATAFHTTCAQRSGVCDVLHEKNEADESVNFHAFCKRHTLVRKREREGASGRSDVCVEASDDESDERSEVLRGLERAFFLHLKCEDVAKRLSLPPLFASDVYEFWKQKRSENGGRPLIAAPHLEIDVDTETPILTLESAQGDSEGQIMLRASDDVQHQLTPFQLKCWRFQKHVFQTADRGRLGCDMIMKRERKKKDIIETNHDLFRHLVELDGQPGIPLSTRVIAQIVDGLQQDMTEEEIAESDRLAEEMASSKPHKRSTGGGEKKGRSSTSEAAATAATPAVPSPASGRASSHASPAKENGVVTGGGGRAKSEGRERTGMNTTPRGGTGGGGSPSKVKRSSSRRTVSFASVIPTPGSPLPRPFPHPPSSLPSLSRSPIKTTPARSKLRPQNPPSDDLPTVPSAGTVSKHHPTTVTPTTPSKLRDRRDVKYF